MAESKNLAWLVISRILLGGVAGGLTGLCLKVAELGLAPAVIIGIAVAAGVAVALVGPKLFELLASSF